MIAAWLVVSGCSPDGPGRPVVAVGTDLLAPDAPQSGPVEAPPPPNLMLVVLDDVGVDMVPAIGVNPRAAPLPTLDALAEQGVVFPNTWGAMYCGAARIQLLTGRWSRRYGGGANPERDGTYAVPGRERYLPELLAAAPTPYSSVAIGKWGVRDGGFPEPMLDPLERGFLHHVGSPHNLDSYYAWQSFDDGVPSDRTGYATTALVDDALDALEALPEPWLLYLAPNAAHAPLELPPVELDPAGLTVDASAPTRARAVLSAFDQELGRLLASLPEEVRQRTVVIVVGDNGSFEDTIEPPFDPARGKGTMYEGGLRVPLLVSGPGIREGAVSDRLVDLADVTATLLELAGVDPGTLGPGGGPIELDGTSFSTQLGDPGAPGPEYAWSEHLGENGPPPWPREATAVRDERFKLVTLGLTESLYDLSGPPLLEGDDLLAATLSPEADEAFARLRTERARIRAEAAYEGP